MNWKTLALIGFSIAPRVETEPIDSRNACFYRAFSNAFEVDGHNARKNLPNRDLRVGVQNTDLCSPRIPATDQLHRITSRGKYSD